MVEQGVLFRIRANQSIFCHLAHINQAGRCDELEFSSLLQIDETRETPPTRLLRVLTHRRAHFDLLDAHMLGTQRKRSGGIPFLETIRAIVFHKRLLCVCLTVDAIFIHTHLRNLGGKRRKMEEM